MAIARGRLKAGPGIVQMSAADWERAARATPDYSFRQAWAYSDELARRRRARAEFVRIDAGAPIGYASVRVKRLPLPGAGLAFVSFGPLVAGGVNADGAVELLRRCLDALVREYVVDRRLALRIAPPLVAPDRAAGVEAVYRDAGFEPSEQAARYRTIIVDLRPPAEDIRRSLDQKWRNQLNNAERRGLAVAMDDGPEALGRFEPLFEQLRQRKDFAVDLDCAFFDRVQRAAQEGSRLVVATVSDGNRDVAGAVVDLAGETAVYVLGATTQEGMKCKAAYALHWSIMMAARDRGCRWYDLGGIDPQENPGVHHFKVGFGGIDITAPGPFEIRPGGMAGMVSRAVEQAHGVREVMRQQHDRWRPVRSDDKQVQDHE